MFFVVKLFVCSIDIVIILYYYLFNKVFPLCLILRQKQLASTTTHPLGLPMAIIPVVTAAQGRICCRGELAHYGVFTMTPISPLRNGVSTAQTLAFDIIE